MMLPQEPCDFVRCAVSDPDPDYLGRRAFQHAESVKVLVLGDEDAVTLAGELPDYPVRRASSINPPDMQGSREEIVQQCQQLLGQLLIKKQSHAQAAGMVKALRSRSAA